MTTSDWITLVGAAVTLIGMAISIWQARSAFNSSQSAKRAMAAVQLASVAERLKSAQEHIRDVAPHKASLRGFKIGDGLVLIRREFDIALSSLPKTGLGSEARSQLIKAQDELNSYETSYSSTKGSETWQRLQAFVQDAVSDLTATTANLGE
ncbi:hypothetical protein JS562_40125 [Agrobacterium sp. S2]|nr:hypothetical protein [Agrobacterium sp. S2]